MEVDGWVRVSETMRERVESDGTKALNESGLPVVTRGLSRENTHRFDDPRLQVTRLPRITADPGQAFCNHRMTRGYPPCQVSILWI